MDYDVTDGYILQLAGEGKSRAIPTEGGNESFYIANFYGQQSGWAKPFGSVSNVYTDGTELNGLILNYDFSLSNNLFSYCWRKWLSFLRRATIFEVVLTDGAEADGFDVNKRKSFKNNLFIVKQLRIKKGVNGDGDAEATLYKINR